MRWADAVIALMFVASADAEGLTLELESTLGKPIADRAEAWPNHIAQVIWLDNTGVIALGEDGFLLRWRVGDEQPVWRIRTGAEPRSVTGPTRDGQLVVLGHDHSLIFISAADGTTTRRCSNGDLEKAWAQPAIPTCFDYLPDQDRFLAHQFRENEWVPEKGLLLMDAKTLAPSAAWELPAGLATLGIHGAVAAAVVECSAIIVVDTRSGAILHREGKAEMPPGDEPFISGAQVDGNGVLVRVIDSTRADGSVQLTDLVTHQQLATFASGNRHAVFDVDGAHRRIAIGGSGRALAVVDYQGHRLAEQAEVDSQRTMVVSYSPDHSRIAVAGWDTTVRVFRLRE